MYMSYNSVRLLHSTQSNPNTNLTKLLLP